MTVSPVYTTFFTLGQKVPQSNFRSWMGSVETDLNAATGDIASLSATVTANGNAITLNVAAIAANTAAIAANDTAIAAIVSALSGIESGATADQTGTEIVTAIDTELGSTSWRTGGGGGTNETNLTFARDAVTVNINSDTGSDATILFASETLAGVTRKATTAEVRGGETDAYIAGNHLVAALAPVTLTFATSQAIDFKGGYNQRVILADDCTLQLPSNPVPGRWIHLDLIQDGTGTHIVGFATGYQFPGKTAPTVTTAANAKTKLSIYCEDASNFIVIANLDIGAPA